MNYKRPMIFGFIYLFLFLSVAIFFNPAFLKDMPEMKLYEGPLEFSGAKAYESLKILTDDYANRLVGSEKGRQSAEWVQHCFEDLGLKSYMQEFDCLAPRGREFGGKETEPEDFSKIMLKSFDDLMVTKKGLNVVGISTGKSNEVIVIGAHRDMIGSIQGAEDNGSGTAALLELARVLTQKEHYHTYVFISFDGEEVGLKGSEFFVKNNKDLNIKAAVIMDMVGFKDANALSFYQSSTARGATQLWTMALSSKVLKSMDLLEYDFKSHNNAAKPTGLFFQLMLSRSFGIVNTDSGPFIDRNIPTIGVKSILIKEGQRGYQTGKIHEPSDTIDQVSPESLEISGRFVEKYVQSISQEGYKGEIADSSFVNYGSKYLSPVSVLGVLAAWLTMILSKLALQFKDIYGDRKNYSSYFRQEKKWLLAVLIYSAAAASFWQVFGLGYFRKAPVFIMTVIYIIAALTAIIVMLILRFKTLKASRDKYLEVTTVQKSILNLIYITAFFVLSAAVSPYAAICLTALPVLVLGHVSYRKEWMRVVWILVFVLWSFIHLVVMLALIQSYIFDLTSLKVLVLSFIGIALWAFSLFYIISAPPVPARLKPSFSRVEDVLQ